METLLGLKGIHWALFGGGLAAALGAVGSSIGVANASKVGTGVLSDDPDKFGSVLILTSLPGTQGFYGFIVALLIYVLFGLSAKPDIPLYVGLAIFFASLPGGIGFVVSAILQGRASQAAIQLIARQPEQIGKAIIFPALVETYAVTSLVVTVFFLLVARAML